LSRIAASKLGTDFLGKEFLFRTGLSFAFTLFLGLGLAYCQTDVLTHHNDNSRTGLNAKEVLLTPSNVNANQFGKLFTQSVDGIIVGQPLVVRNVQLADGKHNVVYVATQHDTVYAFDADSNVGANATPLWSVSLTNGGTSVPINDHGCTGTHYTEIGVVSTPVIDPTKATMYVVSKSLESGQHVFRLHALDVTNGTEKFGGPVVITGSAPNQTGTVTFDPVIHMQRPALLLTNGSVYVSFGSNGCDKFTYHGWLFAYSATSLQQQGVFVTTPDDKGAALWQGGAGPSADANGNIYVATANGTFDAFFGGHDYGDSVVKLGWNNGTLGVIDYFTPYDQQFLDDNDRDLGSSGVLILPTQPGAHKHEMVAGGKAGTLYLIDRDSLGEFHQDDNSQIVQSLTGVVQRLKGVPAFFNGSLYVAGDRDFVKQFLMSGGLLPTTPTSQTTVSFAGNGPSSISISANGKTNGIVWAMQHTGAALQAFDASNLAIQLYSSNQALHNRDKLSDLARFTTPTVANGKVYTGGKKELTVYGLLPSLAAASGNAQTGPAGTVLPLPLTVQASDPYTSAPLTGISVACRDGGAGGHFSSLTLTTDAAGMASVTYTLPVTPKAVTVTCTSAAFSSAFFTETSIVGPPAKINTVSGDKQVAPPNTLLPSPLVVKVADAHNNGVAGIAVTFTDNGAGGVFSAPSGMSDVNGNVSTQYTTPSQTGKVKITASSNGLPSKNLTVTVQ
jgi:Big-like domain-containing protein